MEGTSFTEITKAIDGIGNSFEAYKKANDDQIAAVKSGNEARAKELGELAAKLNGDVTKFTELKRALEVEQQLHRERIEMLEAAASTPAKTPQQKRASEYNGAFVNWIRNKGNSPMDEQKLSEISRKMVEAKDVTIGSAAGGGYAVPEEISRMIEILEKKYSPVRDLVKVVQTGSSDYKELINIRGATSGWVGETGSRTATLTPQLREVAPTFGELYAYPQASEWSLDDIFFNVENWLAEEVASEFAIAEGDAVISGNGSSKPTGMLNTTPVTTADFASPLRAPTAYQYIACANSPVGLTGDCLINLIYALNSAYRNGASFVMNSVTTGSIRKLKDTNGAYLWQPGLQAGQPNSLLGYPLSTWEQLDDIATNAFPVAFGNFKRGYLLADRVGLRITRDNVTNVGFVRFYVRRREGGTVLNNDAIKWLRTT